MKGVYYAVLLENVAMMICWTVLAIYFGKWWIALFSVFCFSSLKHRTDEEGDENIHGRPLFGCNDFCSYGKRKDGDK